MNITEDKRGKDLHLMLMSSSPGILDEDEYELKIEVEENCSLQLHTQSYQRLFNMQNNAKQLMNVHLQNNASFVYLPHPSVPHKDSSFTAINKIHLNNNCNLIWGEILTCGRKLNEEIFKFNKYHNSTEIFINNKLIIKENLLMQPLFINPNSIGQLEGYTHQASLICFQHQFNTEEIIDNIHEFLSQLNEISFGISTTNKNGIIVRIVGYKAEQLHQSLKTIASIMLQPNKVQWT
jgi:urease accessory protein